MVFPSAPSLQQRGPALSGWVGGEGRVPGTERCWDKPARGLRPGCGAVALSWQNSLGKMHFLPQAAMSTRSKQPPRGPHRAPLPRRFEVLLSLWMQRFHLPLGKSTAPLLCCFAKGKMPVGKRFFSVSNEWGNCEQGSGSGDREGTAVVLTLRTRSNLALDAVCLNFFTGEGSKLSLSTDGQGNASVHWTL